MRRFQIGILCFVCGAATSILTLDHHKTEPNIHTTYNSFIGAGESLVAGTISEINGNTILLEPTTFDHRSDHLKIRFSTTEDTTFGEVIRYVENGTIIDSYHYEVEHTTLKVGDTIYLTIERGVPGKIIAAYVKKVILENV